MLRLEARTNEAEIVHSGPDLVLVTLSSAPGPSGSLALVVFSGSRSLAARRCLGLV